MSRTGENLMGNLEVPISLFLLQGLPEAVAVSALAMVVAVKRLDFRQVVITGLSYAAAVYLIRLLPVQFGVHTVANIFVLSLLLRYLLNVKFSRALVVSLIIMAILSFVEGVLLSFYIFVMDKTFEGIYENMNLVMVMGWTNIIVVSLIAWIMHGYFNKRESGGAT